MWNIPLFPERASTAAGQVDALYFWLIGLSAVFIVLIAGSILFFSIRYRRDADVDRSNPLISDNRLEATWIIIPLVLALGTFTWAASLYFNAFRPPADALEINVIGKQWMWKIQHTGGQREINELHVPMGQPVRLRMISQDVIHSFYVPAFRVKMDVVPGRYTTAWFEATKPGQYHLFCAEYCGTAHSKMIGTVVVMPQAEYQTWLSTGGAAPQGQSPAQAGAQLFERFGCSGCHVMDGSGQGPSLQGVFGTDVQLASGQTVTADQSYIRQSILEPNARVVAGYDAIMPSFQGQVSEEQILQLIAYIQSLSDGDGTSGGAQ